MVRTQIRLTDEQMQRLQQLAAKRKVSVAESENHDNYFVEAIMASSED